MSETKNRPADEANVEVTLSPAQSAENARYVENWAVKYAEQIAAHNEMIDRDGMWNDGFQLL